MINAVMKNLILIFGLLKKNFDKHLRIRVPRFQVSGFRFKRECIFCVFLSCKLAPETKMGVLVKVNYHHTKTLV